MQWAAVTADLLLMRTAAHWKLWFTPFHVIVKEAREGYLLILTKFPPASLVLLGTAGNEQNII